ncbi:helix-turn-helix domain-containing protein [Sphaerisporangium corydalis]|uniref:Helix-turn-helix domain-containing protein n=1 Tax=Sphaerisporangium corydalis TaxID=1441875 RepID=A0ABV9EVN0_9ACTN|nr:helix-turn-helix domain-containing protein [Sphaerisporangium corydalis]
MVIFEVSIVMRYAQGGGLTAERRAFRERLRIQAAERFAHGEENAVIARDLRVSVRSVQRWRKAWSQGGERALVSTGPASLPLLSDELFAVLETELDKGPVVHGWPDQTWTLQRHGWSVQVPARRAVERDEAAVAGWVKETWPRVEEPRRRSGHGSSSKTRPGSR